jgi:hypothetical protein
MKKLLSIAVGLLIGVNAGITVNLQKGWQLKGFPFDVHVSQIFNKKEIIAVWAYDPVNKKWKAYIPDSSIDLSKYNVEPLEKIEEYEGFWIGVNKPMTITLDDNEINNQEKNLSNNDNYENINGNNNITSLEDFRKFLSKYNLVPVNYDLTNKVILIGEGWKLIFEGDEIKDVFWSFDIHLPKESNLEKQDNIYIDESDLGDQYDTYFAILGKSNPVKLVVKELQSVKVKNGIVLNVNDLNKTIDNISDVKAILQNNGIETVELNVDINGTEWKPVEKPYNIYKFNENGTGLFNHENDEGIYKVSKIGISAEAFDNFNMENKTPTFKIYILPATQYDNNTNTMKAYLIFVDAKYNKIVGGELLTLKKQ